MAAEPNGATWRAFAAAAAPMLVDFERSLGAPAAAQRRRLEAILTRNADSEYGRRYGFAAIRSYEEFCERVPLTTWQELAPWVERAQTAREAVLTAEAPLFFERTSGSSAARKDVPYTPSMLAELQRALVVWLARLYVVCPRVEGPSYWALSPLTTGTASTPNGIPVGSASDAEYLVGCAAEQLLPTVVDTRDAVRDSADWRRTTLLALAGAANLRLLSVWSPTFATALLEPLFAAATGEALCDWLADRLPPSRRHALGRALAAGDCTPLWPELAVVSCWTDGPSEGYAARLAALLPRAVIQPKGLFATEGVVSVPWDLAGRRPLAIESHVLEFRDAAGRVHAAHELARGVRYEPVLTTSGGLYRYVLGDLVEVEGYLAATPCIRYVGRADARADLVGEKLDSALAAEALTALGPDIESASLVPMADASPPHYVLVVTGAPSCDGAALALSVEARLMRIFHYAQARRLGQLAPLAAVVVPLGSAVLARAWEALGRRAGDFKPAALVAAPAFARAVLAQLPAPALR
jgi:hypothetical protein